MSLLLIATITTAALTFAIGFLPLIRDPNNTLNRSLFALATSVALWMVANYMSNQLWLKPNELLWANRLVFTFGCLGLNTMVLVLYYLTKSPNRKLLPVFYSISLLATFITLTPLLVQSIIPKEPVTEIVFGPITNIFFSWILICLIIGAYLYSNGIRKAKPSLKNRLRLAGLSILATMLLLILFNAALPYVFSNYTPTLVGPLFTIVMISGISYAIRKERLFDVRLTIIRSLANSFSLVTILALYIAILLLIITGLTSSGLEISNSGILVITLVLIIATTTYPFLHSKMSIVTHSLFKSRQYQVQEALNRLNESLAIENTTEGIIKEASKILQNFTYASGIQFKLQSGNNTKSQADTVFAKFARKNVSYYRFSEEDELYSQFSAAYFLSGSTANIGYMLVGHKDNGSTFTRTDRQLLDISTKNLAIALENAMNYDKVLRFNETLKEEVKNATESLRNSNEKLKELDKQKDELMSMASHQIRPQLTATRGFLDLLKDEPSKKERGELISLSTSSIERMIGVVTDMLNLSRFSGGKFEIVKTKMDLTAMLEREVITQNSFAESSGFNIHLDNHVNKAWVMADEAKLREVVANFIHNAVQYGSKDKPIVDIKLARSDGSIEITVRDYGIGVPKDQQDQMFKKFFQATNAKEKRPAGSGVGLFLAKKVIDGHEGTLIFESKEGEGSTFGFSLPSL